MENARVVVFEDRESIRSLIHIVLDGTGHSIVQQATTMQEAQDIISKMEDGDIDIAIVDGNLDVTCHNGSDGIRITSLLREKFNNVVVLGMSATHHNHLANRNLDKSTEVINLGSIIDNDEWELLDTGQTSGTGQ